MRNINTQRKADGKEPQEPWQYFDLMGGTSTGGIIAIMLGRLWMAIPECIKAYTELSKAIFTPKHSRASPKEIKNQIRKSRLAENDDQILLQDFESPCKVCVFALRESNSKLAILRTYDYLHASQTLFDECKVWEACRATSAAPTFFDPVQIGPYKQSFIDGGLGYNNPIFKVYDEAQNIWPDRTVVATSIGTGEVPGTAFGGNLKKIAESITKIVTGCDVVADDFYNANKAMVAEERYYRLSVTHGLRNIGLEKHKHIGEIVDQTQEYLSRGEAQKKIKQCIKVLLQERIDNGNDPQISSKHNGFKSDACLESLKFKEMNFREENIVSADDDTCGWLVKNENFARCIQDEDGLLWIQGKAGAGKSTLMKYVYERTQMPTADASGLKLSFFFHARGVELQKTPLGMFKSLLLQLYNRDSTARVEISKEFKEKSEDGMVEIKWEWTEKMLEELFSNLICRISGSKRVMIFIDALDEAGEVVPNVLASYQAIHYAARGGATEVAEILLKFSSSIINATDKNSVTPLQIAARHYKGDVMRLLIEKGAKPKCLNMENLKRLKEVRGDIEKTVSLLLEDAENFNAQSLQSAAARGDLVVIQVLLAEGTDVNAQGGHYGCALVAAAHNGHIAVAEALLQNGAEIDAEGGMYSCALAAASKSGHEEMVSKLLQAGADINAKSRNYVKALVAAAETGHTKVVKILLKRGAKIDAHSGRFGNALGAAAYNGDTEVVGILLEGGASINARCGEYGNALMVAVHKGKYAVVMLLLRRGAKTNALM
ncbi:hypothetical protein VE03_00052 [Pseudogymnoascus sp. 23342-1-I1]|nr:hypothetical protein VE03_00052 [Pseudogymnoascus sp. 23342-1-I1]